jgi:hypothetical protein
MLYGQIAVEEENILTECLYEFRVAWNMTLDGGWVENIFLIILA